jgi:hypothetical protein
MSLLKRTTSSIYNTSTSPCKTCNNLDPRGHSSSVYSDAVVSKAAAGKRQKSKTAKVELSLPIDTWTLKRQDSFGAKSKEKCRWCGVLSKTLDEFVPEWRMESVTVLCELKMHMPVKLRVKKSNGEKKMIAVYRSLSMKTFVG